jgi:hypothetical protein
MPIALSDVRFSNRPVGVKRFQAPHRYSVDVAHGLALLSGIGTTALIWGFLSQAGVTHFSIVGFLVRSGKAVGCRIPAALLFVAAPRRTSGQRYLSLVVAAALPPQSVHVAFICNAPLF